MKSVQRLQNAAQAYARRDLATAERECRSLLEIAPQDADATHLLGLVRRLQGDVKQAESLLRASIERAPRRAEFHVNYGNLLRATGRLREAEQQFRAALEIDPGLRSARLALTRALNERGAHVEAAAEAQRLVSQNDRDAESWVALASAQRKSGQWSEAESSLRRALALRPEYAVARHNLGALLGQLKRAEESLAELDQAAALGVTGRELEFNRGRALFELGRLDEADAALSAAVRSAPGDIDAHVLLAKLRFMRDEEDFTRDLAAAAVHQPRLRPPLGDLLRRAGQPERAEEVLRSMLREQGWTPAIAAGLAVVLQDEGQLEAALHEAREALRKSPDDEAIVDTVVTLLLQLDQPREAMPLILRERGRTPLDQRWLAHEATAARLMRDPRYQELYDYERFVRPFDLECPPGYESVAAFNEALAAHLKELHAQGFRTHPLDQSLRFGTQTSRSLLVDPDPDVRAFLAALEAPIAEYRRAVGHDASHPLLARNHGDARLVGCWSVRLKRGGYHVNHMHPEGWLSSAYYVEVPDEVADEAAMSGWIKFGEPRMPTPGADPAHYVQPRVGRLVLFPSYMWHGTTPIVGEQPRLTIAFDVVPSGS